MTRTAAPVTTGQLLGLLSSTPLTYRDEADLQAEISARLTAAGIGHLREVQIGPGERIDLLTDDGVGIEVKVAGSRAAVTRQLLRYARCDRVRALLLVSSQASHWQIPYQLGDLTVVVFPLLWQGL